MTSCIFVSDLHGKYDRINSLFNFILLQKPEAVFIGGDILPRGNRTESFYHDFFENFLLKRFENLKKNYGYEYPHIFAIPGNNDPKVVEHLFYSLENKGFWKYIPCRMIAFKGFRVYGYPFVSPTPFHLKDWEKYDTDRTVKTGNIDPFDGIRTVPFNFNDEKQYISEDLIKIGGSVMTEKLVILFHDPPYFTYLDHTGYNHGSPAGQCINHIGSRAIQEFINEKQPWLTLHGHVHESTRLSGYWKAKMGSTVSFNAAHDGPELSVMSFILENPDEAKRQLI